VHTEAEDNDNLVVGAGVRRQEGVAKPFRQHPGPNVAELSKMSELIIIIIIINDDDGEKIR